MAYGKLLDSSNSIITLGNITGSIFKSTNILTLINSYLNMNSLNIYEINEGIILDS